MKKAKAPAAKKKAAPTKKAPVKNSDAMQAEIALALKKHSNGIMRARAIRAINEKYQ